MNAVKKVLEFLKKQWRLLALVLAAVSALGVSVHQFMRTGEVATAMASPIGLGRDLQGTLSQPMQNKQWIEQKRRENSGAIEKYSKVLDDLQRRQKFNSFGGAPVERKPLVDEVLPAATKTTPRTEFRKQYQKAFAAMVDRLHASDRPSERELSEAVDREEKKKSAEQALLESPWAIGRVSTGKATQVSAGDRVRFLWADPRVRFSLERAKGLHMYLDPGAIRQHELSTREVPPEVDEIWQAQMSLWIQQDVVAALAGLNDRAARALVDAGHADRAWVAHLPVKRLMSLAIAGVLGGAGGGGSNSASARFLYPSYTRRQNNEQFFMVPLVLKVVVEAEAIPQVLDAIVDSSFMTPVQFEYDEVKPNWRQIGYVYGQKPVVQLTINIEAYYLHSIFKAFMPPDILAALSQPVTAGNQPEPAGRGR